MTEKKRRKRPLASPTAGNVRRGVTPPVVEETTPMSVGDKVTPEEPKTLDATETTVVSSVKERRPFMEQSSETTSENVITNTGIAIKDGLVGGLKSINEIGAGLVDLVGNTLSDTLQTTGTVANDGLTIAKDVVSGTVQTVADVGTGVTTTVKNVAREVVSGVSEVGGDVLNIAQQTAKGVITGVADIGALVGDVASRTAQGTVDTTKEIGDNVGAVTRSTVEATIAAIDSLGSAAVKTVFHLLVSVVEGAKDVLTAALPRTGAPRE